MKPDFKREYQIDWAYAEAARLRETFGATIRVEMHIIGGVFARGDRVMTISDPWGKGASGAVCVLNRSEEGSLWTALLLPIVGVDDQPVPATRSLESVTLQMRYTRCVHATHDHTIGKPSGAGGIPDLARGVTRLLEGNATIQRKRSLGRGLPTEAYELISA